MIQLAADPDANQPLGALPCRAVALLVDGENIAADLAETLITSTRKGLGAATVLRVYGDAARLPDWARSPSFRFVQAQVAGKSVTDMLIAVEAMELAFTGKIDGLAIASNDRDFAPLVWCLRQHRVPVLVLPTVSGGLGRSIAGLASQAPLPPAAQPTPRPAAAAPPALDAFVLARLQEGPLPLGQFGSLLASAGFKRPEGYSSWGLFLRKRTDLCRVTGSAATMVVRALNS